MLLRSCCCVALLSLAGHGALAQEASSTPETPDLAPLFLEQSPLVVRIEAPFIDVFKSRGDDAEYFPASLFYANGDKVEVEVPLRIKTRGNFRNRERICRFPPLMLNFATRQVSSTLFAGEDRLKLVTHCQPRSQYRQYLLLEYLSYRVLNLLTEHSLRVRLLDIHYVNNASAKPVASSMGFLIEDIERFGARMQLGEVQQKRLERHWYDQRQELVVALFQYLIGNTDWSPVVGSPGEACCHNIFALQGKGTALVPVPYDFDVTGIVNPRYGMPARQLGQRRLTERLYRGACPDAALLDETIAHFVAQRDAIRALYELQEGLSEHMRKRTLDYIDDFYSDITDTAGRQTAIMDVCL